MEYSHPIETASSFYEVLELLFRNPILAKLAERRASSKKRLSNIARVLGRDTLPIPLDALSDNRETDMEMQRWAKDKYENK